MRTNDSQPTSGATVIDLVPVTGACRDLVAWYDHQLAGDQPAAADLQRVVARLQDLPAMPGRIGRDINLVISGDTTRSPGEVVSAVDRLRNIANHNPPPVRPEPAALPRRGRRRRRDKNRSRKSGQIPLPGFEDDRPEN